MRRSVLALLGLLALLGCCALVHAAEKSTGAEDYNPDDYDEAYYEGEEDTYEDSYGYMDNDDEEYYEYYGEYSDGGAYGDEAGEDGEDAGDYYDEYDDYLEDSLAVNVCVMENGKPKLNTTTCDIKLSGVDKQADDIVGGIDGLYKITGCHSGRPLYTRDGSPDAPRALFYDPEHGEWQLAERPPSSEGSGEGELYMYGGEQQHAYAPVFVESWNLAADSSDAAGIDFAPVSPSIGCADGSKHAPADPLAANLLAKSRPKKAITQEEEEAKYRHIYQTYGRRREPNPTASFSFVVLMGLVGLTSILAIPYMLLRKPGKAGKMPPMAASFAQIIQQSKKKQSGHYN